MAAPLAQPYTRISLARARAHWHDRAGLARKLSGDPDEVIARTGWVRTLGGVDVYLAVRARLPGLSRAAVDGLVGAGRLRVIPAVRGCVYLVPAEHAPLALRIAEPAWRRGVARDLEKVGASWTEIGEVARAVVEVLARGPLATDAIRRALPDGAARSFGDRGKKVGLSSPLPIALRELELRGAVERTLEGGRLDSDRYGWRLAGVDGGWTPAVHVPDGEVDRWAELARIFARHAGPTTTADFAAWAGLSRRDARAGVERAGLVPVAVDDYAAEAWVLPEDAVALTRPAELSSSVALLSFEDNYLVAHGGPRWVVDPSHWSHPVQAWGSSKPTTLGAATHVATRTFTVGDLVMGVWELDPDAGEVLWAPFAPIPRAARDAVDRLATETAHFLLDQVGHARSFSLDTDAEVRARAAEVARTAGGGKPEARPPGGRRSVTASRSRAPSAAAKRSPARTRAAKRPAARAPAARKPTPKPAPRPRATPKKKR